MKDTNSYWLDTDLEYINHCTICKSEQLRLIYSDLVDLEEHVPGNWNMLECQQCASLLLNPRPKPSVLFKAYRTYYTHLLSTENTVLQGTGFGKKIASAYLASRYGYGKRGALSMALCAYLIWPLRQQLDYFLRHLPKKKGCLLDVGCGNGGFLQRASDSGWNVVGVELDREAASIARSSTNTQVFTSIELVDGLFDVITLSHVLEHLHDPYKMLLDCRARLRSNGQLWLSVPNIQGLGHLLYGDAWQPLETPRHIVMPSKKALKEILEKSGFCNIQFLRRGRGSFKRVVSSRERAVLLGRKQYSASIVAFAIDIAASISPFASEELVIIASKN